MKQIGFDDVMDFDGRDPEYFVADRAAKIDRHKIAQKRFQDFVSFYCMHFKEVVSLLNLFNLNKFSTNFA